MQTFANVLLWLPETQNKNELYIAMDDAWLESILKLSCALL